MADEENVSGNAAEGKPSKRGKLMHLAVVVGVLALEGAGFFFAAKWMYGGPAKSEAAEPAQEKKILEQVEEEVELVLPEINALNQRDGRMMVYSLQVTIRVKKADSDEIQKILDARKSTILDRLNTVVRSADTKYFSEPDLTTIRRQFRFELDKVLGRGETILEVLIPKFFQTPANV